MGISVGKSNTIKECSVTDIELPSSLSIVPTFSLLDFLSAFKNSN